MIDVVVAISMVGRMPMYMGNQLLDPYLISMVGADSDIPSWYCKGLQGIPTMWRAE